MLNNVAAALNSETYLVPGYLAIGTTEVTVINTTDTVLAGEISDRESLSTARINNSVEYTAINSGADVDTSAGWDIKTVGSMSAETGGLLMTGVVVSGVTQTTNFDIEVVTTINVNRS